MSRELTNFELRELKIRRNRIRRERQLRRRIIAAIAVFIIVLFTSFGLTTILSKAQSQDEILKVKCYASVVVPYGSSVSEVSSEYIDYEYYDNMQEYLDEVSFINHIDCDNITAGSIIIVPYYDEL